MKNRIEQLLQFHNETPDDPFLIYALANAYEKQKDYKNAVKYYELLFNQYPEYEGTYLHYAQLKTLINDFDKAEKIYQKGIATLTELNSIKNLAELQEAYETFKTIAN